MTTVLMESQGPNRRVSAARVALVFLLSLPFILFVTYLIASPSLPQDFARSYAAAQLTRFGHSEQLYQLETFLRHVASFYPVDASLFGEWLYPPFYGLVLVPLSFLPISTAFLLAIGLQLTAFIAAGHRFLWRTPKELLLYASSPLLLALAWGQNSVLLAALYITGFRSLSSSPLLAGIAFAFALMIKPQLGILLPVMLLLGRSYRCIMAGILTTLALLCASLWVSGLAAWKCYLTYLVHNYAGDVGGAHAIFNLATYYHMPSLYMLAVSAGIPQNGAFWIQAAGCGYAVHQLIRTRSLWLHDPLFMLASFALLSLLSFPYMGMYDYTLAASAAIACSTRLYDNRSAPLIFYVAFNLAVFHQFAASASGVVSAPIMAILLWLLLRKKAQTVP